MPLTGEEERGGRIGLRLHSRIEQRCVGRLDRRFHLVRHALVLEIRDDRFDVRATLERERALGGKAIDDRDARPVMQQLDGASTSSNAALEVRWGATSEQNDVLRWGGGRADAEAWCGCAR